MNMSNLKGEMWECTGKKTTGYVSRARDIVVDSDAHASPDIIPGSWYTMDLVLIFMFYVVLAALCGSPNRSLVG